MKAYQVTIDYRTRAGQPAVAREILQARCADVAVRALERRVRAAYGAVEVLRSEAFGPMIGRNVNTTV